MSNGTQKKRIKEIANFIVNNITLAEVSSIIIERAMEVAEYIVKNDLDPKDMGSTILRNKLYQKLKKTKPTSYNPFSELEAQKLQKEAEEEEEVGLFARIWKAIKNEKPKPKERNGFTTKNNK
jgi:hypothetical protein